MGDATHEPDGTSPRGRDGRGDRYGSLLESLRAAGEPTTRDSAPVTPSRATWHPVAIRLIVGLAIVVALYAVFVVGSRFIRDARVDTWSGPDATVQSGQRLAGCPIVDERSHDILPSWVRYGGVVYRLMEAIIPLGAETGVGETRYTESGYSLGTIRLLLDDETPAGRARDRVIVIAAPALVGQLYERTDCR